MSKVLVLGAGLVAKPLVRYLLSRKGYEVTVASRTERKAQALISGAQRATALKFDIQDSASLDSLVEAHELAISLLPAAHHTEVAKACLRHGTQMVTTSYVSPTMSRLDQEAKEAGIILLNEIGLDPGIDHMSAMKVMDAERDRGARITAFRSYCGGLPAPEANTNPWGYKFSWSPRGVVLAGKNSARYLKIGDRVEVPSNDLFTDVHNLEFEDIGTLEAYPNRDSLAYIHAYGLSDIRTMYRGTLRYPGWCALWKAMVDLDILDEQERTFADGETLADWMCGLLGCSSSDDLRGALAERLGVPANGPVVSKLAWLGVLDDQPVPFPKGSNLDVLCRVLQDKLTYRPDERDMIVMRHVFDFEENGGASGYRITSTLVDYGEPGGDSSMSRTVGLPAAIAARLILEGEITATGVHIPVSKRIYLPVLDELEQQGVHFIDTRQTLG